MWKKLFCAALIAALSLGLSGCGEKSSTPGDQTGTPAAPMTSKERRDLKREGAKQQAPAPGAQEAPAAAEQK